MTYQYLVRAKLGDDFSEYPTALPRTFGNFLLDFSKNRERMLVGRLYEHGIWEKEDIEYNLRRYGIEPSEDLPELDHEYPMSHFFIEIKIEAENIDTAIMKTHSSLGHLEALFRLFQPGNVFVRRYIVYRPHGIDLSSYNPRVYDDEQYDLEERWPVPPEPFLGNARQAYRLGNADLADFVEFFNQHWPVVSQEMKPLNVALSRFSSSYEKLTLGDRLVDLVIALEAFFGGGDRIAHNVAQLSAKLIYPAGKARDRAYCRIKGLYHEERSPITHGGRLTTNLAQADVDQLEDFVRSAITKLLALRSAGIVSDEKEAIKKYVSLLE